MMKRRELLVGAGVVLASAGVRSAQAAEGAGAAAGNPIAGAAAACLVAGEACLDHCLKLLSKGDTSIAVCGQRVHDMLGTMNALLRLASSGSSRLAALGSVAKDICRDCEVECRKHQDHHAICRDCADACARTVAVLSRA